MALSSPAGPPVAFSRALGIFVIRRYALCAALVLALMACNVLAGLGTVRVNDSDEARYGVSAHEMLQSGSFLVPTYAGDIEYWNLKPPLGYWLTALSFKILGVTPFALRLPSALCGILVVGVTMGIARRWLGRRVSLLSGLMVATGYGFLSNHGARSGDLDAALTLVLLLALLQTSRIGKSPWRIVSLGSLLSVAFLLKSFAIAPLVVVAVIDSIRTGSWRRQRALPAVLALAAFVVPVGIWAAARWHADGSSAFLVRMVREDLFDRSTQVIDRGTSAPWDYAGSLFDRFAPWPEIILIAAWVAARAARYRLRALVPSLARGRRPLVLLWALVPLVLFSVARTHHHWYLDPSYPAWAMLAALAFLDLARRARPARRTAVLALCVIVPLTCCELRVLDRALFREPLPEFQRVLMSLRDQKNELGTRIRTSPLRHSERFILEAMDGFRVDEIAEDAPAARTADPRPSSPVLIGKATPGPRPEPPPHATIVVETKDYVVYRGG